MSIGGTPVGNMIIKVDLDSTGVERSMTGLQRQLRSSNKAMGAQLSAFGRGEKSAEKYGVLIEGLSNRHKIQAQMVEEAKKRYEMMSDEYGENSVKAQQAGQQLNEQIARYQETGRELDSLKGEFEEFQRVQEIQSKGWYKVADGMDEFGGKLKASGKVMDDTGKSLTRKVTLPLTAVGGLAVKTGSDFEAGMSRVGAVSGASAEEMEQLETKAREMGATTVFSATEASDAFYYMSLAGWDAQESMDGINGVMDLAAASGEDLAQVADIVTDGLTAFNMEAGESGRMADVLAAASANANTDVSGLGAAFQYVAPVAGALGYTIEDTSKAIGLMSNSGIKAQKAGTALRKMMNSIAKPTAEAEKLMDKYGISLTDSEGNMKSFDKVMKDLRKGLGDLNEEQQAQAAATIFGQEAMSGALAIVNASEKDYKKLTEEIKNSDGAASDMADTMQDNLQGSVKELKSMIEDLFIEMYQNLKPTIESVIDSAKNLTEWFSNLSPKTQENIIKFGLLAATMGPVLSITGKLTMGVGGLMQGTGALAKTIGLSKGTGLLGAMGGLGPLAVGGVAVAGLTAVGVAAYNLYKDSKELEEVNLDVAQSLSDQALELDKNVETFEKLSDKAKISNKELAELNDLNIRISESSNPGEISELQKQYDRLAKKSGLSKDELKELFKANSNIIEQSPDVEKSVSDQGNAFVESTDAVKEYIESMYEASLVELKGQVEAALENQNELLKHKNKLQEEHGSLLDEMQVKIDANKLSEEENKERQKEINELLQDRTLSYEEAKPLQEELTALLDIENGDHSKAINYLQEKINKKNEEIKSTEEDIQLNKELISQASEIALKQAGINKEGEKGLAQLDESIAKNEEELAKLEEKLQKNGELTEEEQKRYDKLSETNEKQREVRDYLYDELGIYKDLNSLAETKLEQSDKQTQINVEALGKLSEIKVEEGNIVGQIQKKNSELDKSISKLEKQKDEEGANKKEIDKQIKALEDKKKRNDQNIEAILKELGIWDDVKDSIESGAKKEKDKGKVTDETTGKLSAQGKEIDDNNKKTDIGIGKEKERTKEAGTSVDKSVTARDHGSVGRIDAAATKERVKKVAAKDYGSVARIDRMASAAKNKRVNAKDYGTIASLNRQASNPVTKVVNFVGKGLSKLKFWAKGTPPSGHPGGMAVVGERGRELIQTPSGATFMSPDSHTLLNLPKGTHVIPNKATERLMRSIPKYADGTSGWSNLLRETEFARLLAINNRGDESTVTFKTEVKNTSDKDDSKLTEMVTLLLEQNQHLQRSNEILTALLGKDLDLYKLNRKVDEGLNDLGNRRNAAWGG